MKLKAFFEDSYDRVVAAWQRFPFAAIAACLATIFVILGTHADYGQDNEVYYGVAMAATWAHILLLAVTTKMEGRKAGKMWLLLGRLAAIALSILMYFAVFQHYDVWSDTEVLEGFFLFVLVTIALVVGPYAFNGKLKSNGFWHYAYAQAWQILQAFLYFGVLYIGLVLLYGASDILLFDVPEEFYIDTWFFIVGVMVSTFFMMGIPKKLDVLEKKKDSPKWISALVRYVGVPLIFLYLILLYVYTGTIVATWDWPSGEVAIWVLIFLVLGTITYFVSWRGDQDYFGHVGFYRKALFWLMIPQLVVLYLAIDIRIDEYGFTEPRYLIVAFAVWLAVSAIYYVVSRKKSLKFLPMALFAVLLVTLYGGPLSAENISRENQLQRFVSEMEELDILVDGKVPRLNEPQTLVYDDYYNIDSIVRYLIRNHGLDVLQPYFEEDLSYLEEEGVWFANNEVMDMLGLDSENRQFHNRYVTYKRELDCVAPSSGKMCPRSVAGYDYYLPVTVYYDVYGVEEFSVGTIDYEAIVDADGFVKILDAAGGELGKIDLNALLFEDLPAGTDTSLFANEGGAFVFERGGFEIMVRVESFSFLSKENDHSDSDNFENVRLSVLYR